MTVNQWIDKNIDLLYNRQIRLLDSVTHVGYTDKMLAYMDKEVKATKVTSKFVFVFIWEVIICIALMLWDYIIKGNSKG